MVTIQEQRVHVRKIKRLAKRIKEYEDSDSSKYECLYLSKDDLDTIKRALACHMAVITLDIKKQEGKI